MLVLDGDLNISDLMVDESIYVVVFVGAMNVVNVGTDVVNCFAADAHDVAVVVVVAAAVDDDENDVAVADVVVDLTVEVPLYWKKLTSGT